MKNFRRFGRNKLPPEWRIIQIRFEEIQRDKETRAKKLKELKQNKMYKKRNMIMRLLFNDRFKLTSQGPRYSVAEMLLIAVGAYGFVYLLDAWLK